MERLRVMMASVTNILEMMGGALECTQISPCSEPEDEKRYWNKTKRNKKTSVLPPSCNSISTASTVTSNTSSGIMVVKQQRSRAPRHRSIHPQNTTTMPPTNQLLHRVKPHEECYFPSRANKTTLHSRSTGDNHRDDDKDLKNEEPFDEREPPSPSPARHYTKRDTAPRRWNSQWSRPSPLRESASKRAARTLSGDGETASFNGGIHRLEPRPPKSSHVPREIRVATPAAPLSPTLSEIPIAITISDEQDAASEVSFDDLFSFPDHQEGHSFTPHPSLEVVNLSDAPCGRDFRCLYEASLKQLDDQDWPSDEDTLAGKGLETCNEFKFASVGTVWQGNPKAVAEAAARMSI